MIVNIVIHSKQNWDSKDETFLLSLTKVKKKKLKVDGEESDCLKKGIKKKLQEKKIQKEAAVLNFSFLSRGKLVQTR